MVGERRSSSDVITFWRAVADVAVDRPAALASLEAAFRRGSAPSGSTGFHRGRLVASTAGYALDLVIETLARVWMPWKGKTFDPSGDHGWNVFDARGRWVSRLLWPSYDAYLPFADDVARPSTFERAFRFVTSTGESALIPGVTTLRIDYDLEENPAWPLRRILDEVVAVDDGVVLGQALLNVRDRWRRVAWFVLEAPTDGGRADRTVT